MSINDEIENWEPGDWPVLKQILLDLCPPLPPVTPEDPS